MREQEGVLGMASSTFSLWASFRQSRNEPVLGLFSRYLGSDFIVIAASVESAVVREFSTFINENSDLVIGNIDGDPTPNALWLGHWTHFFVKHGSALEPLVIPQSISQSEKALQRILRRGFPKPKHGRRI